ncbi:ribosomal protein S18-alanine N-acetyltransferase [Vagococcus acidifermentans]|uniref:[Ribosomal protein bS18]-alanine N-acetyltransferase n=1 Tax=Vagococcus acidifermentans TaxID=564710 RepID=A0A430AXT4_9ENTE|nr:ribosomal protein S18-alanine N-acetyltransferase [Vagococcus acidifermentans]RSU12858.1 ribosomal-protein-alanine N-acetyltransferase [Vagococcus acidifermentans]
MYFNKSAGNLPAFARALFLVSAEAYPTGSPWTEKQFLEHLLQHGSHYFFVLKAGAVVGYLGIQTVLDESEIMNFAVLPSYKRLGLGKQLMAECVSFLKQEAVQTLFLEVREGNIAALNFYKRNGFKKIGSRSGYYHHPVEDAVLMSLNIQEVT